jgi:hypothetical protein
MGYGRRLGAILKHGESIFIVADKDSQGRVRAVPVHFDADEGHSIHVPAGIICERECFLNSRTVKNFHTPIRYPCKVVGHVNKKYMPFVVTVYDRYHL